MFVRISRYSCHTRIVSHKESGGPLLHHAAAVLGQAAVGVADVGHILGAPQAFPHSTGTRPAARPQQLLTRVPQVSLNQAHWEPPLGGREGGAYHILGIRLVESTYSPHMQASPPITSFFCSSVPVQNVIRTRVQQTTH